MAKKYYAWLYCNGESYVMRFRIDGSLHLTGPEYNRVFEDSMYYTRSADDIIYMAFSGGSVGRSNSVYQGGWLIDHDKFVELRSKGTPRIEPKLATIKWT